MKLFRVALVLTLLASSVLAVACNATTDDTSTPLPGLATTCTCAGAGRTGSAGGGRTTATLTTEFTVTGSPLPSRTLTPLLPTTISSLTPTTLPCDPAITYCIEIGHFLLDCPIAQAGTVTIDPTYPYGSTQNGARPPHHGVEFYNASGTPVLAAADGLVIVAGDDKGGAPYSPSPNFYGNLIILEHHLPGVNQPVYTLYGHLSKIEVQSGQNVRAGEKIGEVGASGAAIGSHLHFEVRLGENNYDSNRNPVLWLKPLSGEDGNPYGLVVGQFVDAQRNSLYYLSLNIQYFPEVGGPQATAYAVETYAPEKQPVHADDQWQENFALGDLPAGHYRINFIWAGVLFERWVEVQPGKLTVVMFIVK